MWPLWNPHRAPALCLAPMERAAIPAMRWTCADIKCGNAPHRVCFRVVRYHLPSTLLFHLSPPRIIATLRRLLSSSTNLPSLNYRFRPPPPSSLSSSARPTVSNAPWIQCPLLPCFQSASTAFITLHLSRTHSPVAARTAL